MATRAKSVSAGMWRISLAVIGLLLSIFSRPVCGAGLNRRDWQTSCVSVEVISKANASALSRPIAWRIVHTMSGARAFTSSVLILSRSAYSHRLPAVFPRSVSIRVRNGLCFEIGFSGVAGWVPIHTVHLSF